MEFEQPRSLADRVREDKVVYVENMTIQPQAMVVCHFRVPGRTDALLLKIPPTPKHASVKFPYEIFPGRLPLTALKDGADEFLRFIEHGILRYVPKEEAQQILSNREVRQEVQDLFKRANSNVETRRWARKVKMEAETGMPISGSDEQKIKEGYVPGPGSTPRLDLLPQSPAQQLFGGANVGPQHPANASALESRGSYQVQTHGAGQGVGPQLQGLIAAFSPANDASFLKIIKGMKSNLGISDLNFIIQRTGATSACSQWAQQQLQSLLNK